MKPQVELDRLVKQVTEYIEDLASDIRIEYEPVIYEDEDANLSVYPPLSWSEDRCLDFQSQITEYTTELHLNTGYIISVYVLTPAQQVDEAQRELAKAEQRLASLRHLLCEAQTLGLMQTAKVEAIPA
jgi:hypothetical protein